MHTDEYVVALDIHSISACIWRIVQSLHCLQVTTGQQAFIDGEKRKTELSFMNVHITMECASFQDEVMIRFMAWVKEQVVAGKKVHCYPWESHFTGPSTPTELEQTIYEDTLKASQ